MATDPSDLVRRLSAIPGRATGTDAERRAARLLARELRAGGREARVETFWVRPAWGIVQAAAMALGVAGSVASVDHPGVGLALLVAALVVLVADLGGRFPLFRQATFARATQNVISPSTREAPVRLIVTAAVDAPRTALIARDGIARRAGRLRRALRGHLPGVHGTVVVALLALIALAAVRQGGAEGLGLGLVQLLPTVVLLLAAGAFLDAAVAPASAGANANASAAAVAVALTEALHASPPRNLAVDLVLAGAGEAHALGMRREVRVLRRAGTKAQDVVVLHVAPCGAGSPVWWTREGPLIPLRYHSRLLELCEAVADAERHLGARAHESRTFSGARAARARRWPAIAVGCVDADGVAPHAAQPDDDPDHVDPAALRAALEFCVALVHRVDADLSGPPQRAESA
jgi:hypothetical protein